MRTPLLISLVLLAASCKDKKKDQGGRYKLRISGAPAGSTILVSGKPAGVLDERDQLEITLPVGVFLRDGKGSVGIRLDEPCGPKDVAFSESSPPDFHREKRERTMAEAVESTIELPTTAVMHRFWVDRKGAPTAKITIGSFELREEMTPHNRIDLLWPTCEEGHVVRVDGKEVGRLPAQEPTDQELVIATKPTCYGLREVMYTPGTYGKGDDKVFVSTQMVWSRPIDYFLTYAPDEVWSKEEVTKRELMAIDCPKGK